MAHPALLTSLTNEELTRDFNGIIGGRYGQSRRRYDTTTRKTQTPTHRTTEGTNKKQE